MRFWQVVSFSETEQLAGIAQGAEEAGFHGVLISDHLFFPETLRSRYPYSDTGAPAFDGRTPFPDPWTAIAAMAQATERLRFATLVYILPLREPLQVAKTVGTASLLSGGRVALGCGAGWIREEYEAVGVDFATRGARFDEMIDVLRSLWAGGVAEHHGRFFDLPPLRMSPAPAAPIPIWVGGLAPAALRRAAVRGDGWIGLGHDPAEVPALLERLRALRADSPRAGEPFETIVPLTVPPAPELLRRLEAETGMTSTTAYPFLYTIGPKSTLEQKRDAMRRFGDEVIAKTGKAAD